MTTHAIDDEHNLTPDDLFRELAQTRTALHMLRYKLTSIDERQAQAQFLTTIVLGSVLFIVYIMAKRQMGQMNIPGGWSV